MLCRRALLTVAFLACPLFALAAGPVVIDFEDTACTTSSAQCPVGEAYLSKGFALRTVPSADELDAQGLVLVGKAWRHSRHGSQAMSISSCGATVTLMANDNSLFDALAISLAEMHGEGAASVAFTARLEDGSELHYTVKLNGKVGWQRVSLPATFRKLVALSWQQGNCVSNPAHMFDQIELTPHAP
jgi:hypothetical protein